MDGDLVFDDGEVYSRVEGSELDDYLMLRAEYKSRVLNLLAQAFNGISDTCGKAADERLFCTLDSQRSLEGFGRNRELVDVSGHSICQTEIGN
jgi:hypothetical protein